MTHYIGLDVGGTKIAGAIYDEAGNQLAEHVYPTPSAYEAFLNTCKKLVDQLETPLNVRAKVGIGMPGPINSVKGPTITVNIPCIAGNSVQSDLERLLVRRVRFANDANCLALAEAIDGAGQGHEVVFCLIIGTGMGGGLVINGKLLEGRHGLSGEVGHLPLPFRAPEDGPLVQCGCKQEGCIDKTVSGPGLIGLYQFMTGNEAQVPEIADLARAGDEEALHVLNHFYEMVAKAMIVPIYAYDPDVIVISGGLNGLPGFYDEVPKRWEKYCLLKDFSTPLVPAKHGPKAGLRGAAFLWRE